ncbi:hypothetical protein [Crenothrix polyspora]|uniref:DnaJ-like protein n=1 Tax=Crenothrix polyspora TaxID=360316 RepID=A0A1R4GYS8_9GAMM|nr:hypothetical protein [Crenothrix polyspora]SJM89118.1 DnaJ-like protein [Crenothrix polyspora]
MTKTSKIVLVDAKAQAKTLTPAQKQFNSLSKKIAQQKKTLLAWKENIPVYHQKNEQEYNPLVETLHKHQIEWMQQLDKLYDDPSFKPAEKNKIKLLIAEQSEDLISEVDTDEVKALFNKYNDADFDTIKGETNEAVGEMMRNIAKNMFNIDIGDDFDVSSPEKFKAQLEEKMRALEEEDEKEPAQAKIAPKKTKAQLAKEARQKEEEALASKSVQEVYRKLVAVLHPDREPDEKERERKTELMQRVNIAYGKKDLLQLLELQLEIEQIDATQLGQMADSRLKHFNKILKEQLAELEQEIYKIEEFFSFDFDSLFFGRQTPAQLMLQLADKIVDVKDDIAEIKEELELFKDVREVKIWLKSFKIPQKSPFDGHDNPFGFPFGFSDKDF